MQYHDSVNVAGDTLEKDIAWLTMAKWYRIRNINTSGHTPENPN